MVHNRLCRVSNACPIKLALNFYPNGPDARVVQSIVGFYSSSGGGGSDGTSGTHGLDPCQTGVCSRSFRLDLFSLG